MTRFRTYAFRFLSFCTLATASALAYADTGGLLVTVANEENRPLSGSTITIESRQGETWEAVADSSGRAIVQDLRTGLYLVVARSKGSVPVVEPEIRVVRGKTTLVEMVLPRDRYEGIEEMIVVANAIRSDAYGGVGSSYLDREHLRTATGSGADVLRALDGLPGLHSTGEFASYTVRGHGPLDNLILVDGFPYDKVVHFNESIGEEEDISGGGRFSIFAPNLIDGVEFSPGGWSAAYSGRNGSLLKLDVAKGNPSPTASFRLDIAGAEVTYDGPSKFHDGTSLLASARRFDFGQLFEIVGERDIGDPVMTDLILKTHTRIDAANELEFLLLHTPERSDRTVENVIHSENLEDRELIHTTQDSMLLGVTWKRLIGEDGLLENRLYFRDTDKTSSEGEAFPFSNPMPLPVHEVPIREEILTLTEVETEFGFRSDLSLSNRWGLFGAGVRLVNLDLDFTRVLSGPWIRYQYDSSDFHSNPANRYIVLTPEDTSSAFTRSERQYAVYAEQVFETLKWDFRVGARYDFDGFSDRNVVAPRLSANYRLSPTTRIAATMGTFYQSPRFLDRAADPENAALRSERVDHFSLGINRRFGDHWNLLLEAYHQRLDDLVTEGDAVTGISTNSGSGSSLGVDVVLNRYFDNRWSANALYSFNDATRDDHDGNGEYAPDYNHRHVVGIGAKWEISQRWQVGFRWKFATGRPRDEFVVHNNVLAAIGGPLRFSQEFVTNNTARWDNFHTLNVRLDYRRPAGPLDLVAFLDILNLYGGSSTDELEFNPATGAYVADDGDAFPLIGIRFEKTW